MSDLFDATEEPPADTRAGIEPAAVEPAGVEPAGSEPAARERHRRWPFVVLGLLVLLVAGLGAVGIWVHRQIDPPGGPGEEVTFVVAPGASARAIGAQLEAEGVITDARVFRLYLRLRGEPQMKAGEYVLARRSAMGTVVAALEAGPVIRYVRLTIPEGLTVEEIAARVERVDSLSTERFHELLVAGEIRSRYHPEGIDGPRAYEGLLFPDTYQLVSEREDESDLLRRMVGLFDQVADRLGLFEAEERIGIPPYEAIIVASLVEAEAKTPEDRAKIARVILNRIEMGMKLEIDATVYYALGRRGGPLTRSDLEVDSPYNTRRFAGIPPTPIAVPGRAALEATINPADGDWLFYVRTEDSGAHSFSSDYNQFLRDRRICQEKGWC